MKKLLALWLAMMLLVVSCGNTEKTGSTGENEGKKETENKVENKESSGTKGIVVNLTYKEVQGYDEWFEASKKEFEEMYPGVTLNISKMASNEGDYNTKTSLMLQSDDTIDVMVVDSFLVPSLVATGSLSVLPVETWDDWNEHYPNNVKEGMTFNGKVYAAPYNTDTRGLYYNLKVFEKAGIATPWEPKSWEEVLNTVEKLHKADVPYPIWMNGSKAQGEATTMQTFEMLLAGTPDWLYENEKWITTSQGFKDALGFLEKINKMGIYDNNELATMLDANGWQTLNEKFPKTEEIGIILDGSWKGAEWIKVYPENHLDVIKVTPFPNRDGNGFASMSGGWTLVVSEMSDVKEEAFNFIKVALNQKNTIGFIAKDGDMTVRKDVADSEEYKNQNAYRSIMTNFTEFTKFRPGVEAYPSVSIEIQAAVESVITGKMTADEAMKLYAESVKSIVGEGEYIDK